MNLIHSFQNQGVDFWALLKCFWYSFEHTVMVGSKCDVVVLFSFITVMLRPRCCNLASRLRDHVEYVNARWMKSLQGFLPGIKWIMFHGHLDYSQKPPLGGRSKTKPGDHGNPNAHNCWFTLFYHVWRPAWIEIHWNSLGHIWLHTTLESSVTSLHDFESVLGWPLITFFWALTVSWSQLLARVWCDP